MNYKESGVNIELADRLVEQISNSEQIGKFAANFTLPAYHNRNIVTSCDGVGTKILLALEAKRKYNRPLQSIGQDCVGMVANDILCENATPLLFMDYFATGKLEEEIYLEIIGGLQYACGRLKIPLIGGETSEMPDMFAEGAVDLCGFSIGVKNWLHRYPVEKGDRVIGIHSSGVHSNGFSLIRKLIEKDPVSREFLNQLLEPTRLYSSHVNLLDEKHHRIKAVAHITGGGFDNLNRVLSKDLTVKYHETDCFYAHSNTFSWIQERSGLSMTEMRKTFHCGIGMMVIIPAQDQVPFEDYSELGVIENVNS